jgi:biopolymer transport protein ExbB/TolQ
MHGLVSSPFLAGIAPHAITFAYKHLTPEGFFTICALLVVSVFSWTVIISKARQLIRAKKATKSFYEAYRTTRDPLALFRKKEEFDGSHIDELANRK